MASVAGANGKPFKLVRHWQCLCGARTNASLSLASRCWLITKTQVLLGETAVGKSSLVLRYMKNEFHTRIQSTMGGECVCRVVVHASWLPLTLFDLSLSLFLQLPTLPKQQCWEMARRFPLRYGTLQARRGTTVLHQCTTALHMPPSLCMTFDDG